MSSEKIPGMMMEKANLSREAITLVKLGQVRAEGDNVVVVIVVVVVV